MRNQFVLIALFLSLFGATALAQTVKGQPRYKSVDQEEQSSESGDYFQGAPSQYAQNFFVGLGFDYFDAFGVQGRYAVRVLDGLIEGLNNPLNIEGGLGATFYGDVKGKRGVSGFNFVVTGRWDFQMTSEWVFFANAGFGFNAVSSGLTAEDVKGGGFFPAVGVGAMFNFLPDWAVRADVSYQFIGAGIVHRF